MYDALGNGIEVGTVLQGFGLANAGRHYTVLRVGKGGRVWIERHIDGKRIWTFLRYYRVVEGR